MQTFEELEKKWLDEHYTEYKAFTRLLLTFSVGAMTFLLSFHREYAQHDSRLRWMVIVSLGLLFVSSAAGLLVQNRLMHIFLERLEKAKKLCAEAVQKGSQYPIKIRQAPNVWERSYYQVQVWCFFAAYLMLTIYVFKNLEVA